MSARILEHATIEAIMRHQNITRSTKSQYTAIVKKRVLRQEEKVWLAFDKETMKWIQNENGEVLDGNPAQMLIYTLERK